MQQTVAPSISARKVGLLALLAASDGPIVGITRLQKLLFLMWKRLDRVSPDRKLTLDFDFHPERYGPADFGVYSDLDFLAAMGHIARTNGAPTPEELISGDGNGESPTVEEATENEAAFDYLMRDEEDLVGLAAAERNEQAFQITEHGRRLLERLAASESETQSHLVEAIRTAASETLRLYGHWPLSRLLRFVYSEYPEMTTASEIRERVLPTY